MTYRGRVKNGVVVLEGAPALPEDTVVSVEPVETVPQEQTLGSDLMRFAGSVKGMPTDMSRNHDHYAHGAPRK
jgi:hypothetical protein